VERALQTLDATDKVCAASYAWSRRLYAPLLFREEAFASLRADLEAALPDHVALFDVVFETPPGRAVDFHTDYESLGPFEVGDPWVAVRDAHFVSVHFNLTSDGGALVVLPWPRLSWIFYHAIVYTGLYGTLHRVLNSLCRPLLALFGEVRPNSVGVGNVFNNMCLHAVQSADVPRVSYVVRLVRRGARVLVTETSLRAGAARGETCARVRDVLAPRMQSGVEVVDAATLA
jgi:hypothetical protein